MSEALDASRTIDEFLQAAAAKRPTPGGGSVVALVGALAAAMGEMTLNYTVAKKDLAEHRAALEEALQELTRARSMLLELMVEDQIGYAALTAAHKGRQAGDDSAYTTALVTAIRIPQTIGATASAVLEIAQRVVNLANVRLLSDLAICADLAMVTVRGAAYNVRANLPEIANQTERARIAKETDHLVERAVGRVRQVSQQILARTQSS